MKYRLVPFASLFVALALLLALVPCAVQPALSAPPQGLVAMVQNPGTTTRVSVASDGEQGNDYSGAPSISADGRYVAFGSYASNLVSGDTNDTADVFVHDRQTGQTSRVSVASDGGQGYVGSNFPSISADGRYVVFYTSAPLVGDDTNSKYDVFIHDRQTGQTSRVSVASDGSQGTNHSRDPSISADGRYVAFGSNASNLVGDDTNGKYDVFIHDRQMGQTSRVSVASDGEQGNFDSYFPSISADGRYVAFESYASNLVGDDTNGKYDVFIHDRQTGQTSRVSVASDGSQGNNHSRDPSISADGRYVAFRSDASNLVGDDTNPEYDVFIHDRQTGQTSCVSVASDGEQGNDYSGEPSISADGRYVAFKSKASNLVGDDTNDWDDVFIHDRQTGQTSRVSVTSDGGQGNNQSDSPSISADGRYVAFESYARNLVGDDTNDTADVFVHEREGGLEPGRPPIVFVHGWQGLLPWGDCGDPEPDFGLVDNDLSTAGYHVEYAILETSPCYTPPLTENVDELKQAIDSAKAATGQDQVILITHSMGGLVSRAYIEGPDYAGDVEALFTFGSPHRGVPADFLAFLANGLSLGKYCEEIQPAVCDFSETGMILFNQTHSNRAPGVVYHAISGDAPFSPRSGIAKATKFLLPGGDDGAVQTHSGIGLDGILDRWVTDEVHSTGMGPRSYFVRDDGQSMSYTQCLKPVLVDKIGFTCGDYGASGVTATASPVARTPFEYGTLLLGEITTYTVTLGGGASLFATRWATGTIELTLVDPIGQMIDPDYAASHPDIVTYAADDTVATYDFPDAIAGNWDIVLEATAVPAEGSAYTSFAAFDSNVALTASTDQTWYAPGSTATVTATISGSPDSATVTATILYADGVSDTVSLPHQGAGQYQGTGVVHDAPGYAEVQLIATGTTSSSSPFERGFTLAFQVSPDTIALTGEYADTPEPESPGSYFYEALVVTVGFDSTLSGTVGLSANLVDAGGNHVAHSLAVEEVVPGSDVLTLRFNGDDIYSSQRDGPYTLTHLLITDQSGPTLVVAEADDVYATATYDYRRFGGRKVYLPLVLRNN